MRKIIAVILVLFLSLALAGCSKKGASTTNQNIKTLVDGYQNSMVSYYSVKSMQDSSLLINQVNDSLKKVEDSKKKLEQLTGINETVTDAKIKAELSNFIDLGRERERIVMKYLDDLRRDLDYKYRNPDAQVDINKYISQIPNNLLDLEYQSKQSNDRLQQLLVKK
ncbi:MAG: hypothetical protein JL50_02130 [Peptococcaceae bacterium BICA1-7]|nr:MAG: hypothetical protein JL50_02130 [Peptococcaceae bacterium BICA1-7]HBV95425.1 hypothetical protein [Desulfotomaculum sp.]